MKELSIEEKAKRYDEAIKKFDIILNLNTVKKSGTIFADDVRKIFPELKKCEDERIRNNCIHFLELQKKHHAATFEIDECIAWLEKESENGTNENNREIPFSEQNLAEKIDALMSLDEAIEHCEEKSCGNNACALEHKQLEKWLTELKELKEQKSYASETMDEKGDFDNGFTRMMEKEQNHVWSEEDKEMSRFIGNAITADDASMYLKSKGIQVIDVHVWLEKLKERVQSQNTWRPSDEQMEALGTYIYNPQYFNSLDPRMELVESVYKDLKKLKKNIETI